MTRANGKAAAFALLCGWLVPALGAWGGQVAAQENDWPCMQRLVPRLEPGQMWAGPPLGNGAGEPAPGLAALAEQLADPGLAPEAVAERVRAYQDSVPPDRRGQALAQLFEVTLDRINAERATLIEGIKRYARGQRRLAERIGAETRELDRLQRSSGGDAAQATQDLQAARDWDARVFGDRQRSLGLVCEQPVRLEQRAFALARIIQEQLP
jgi:hypothetical protein